MKSFKCIKSFFVDEVDGDGFSIENKYIDIPEDSIWYMPQDKDYRFMGGEVRLESDELDWIEISNETFQEHFEEIVTNRRVRMTNIVEVNKEVDPDRDCGSTRCPCACERCPYGIPEMVDCDSTSLKC